MVSRPLLAAAIALWTLLAWGGRIRLLTDVEQSDPGNWVRIGGSLLVGLAAVLVLALGAGGDLERWVLTVFAVWTVGVWLRSSVGVLGGDGSVPFKVVHVVLAAGFLTLAVLALRRGWTSAGA